MKIQNRQIFVRDPSAETFLAKKTLKYIRNSLSTTLQTYMSFERIGQTVIKVNENLGI